MMAIKIDYRSSDRSYDWLFERPRFDLVYELQFYRQLLVFYNYLKNIR